MSPDHEQLSFDNFNLAATDIITFTRIFFRSIHLQIRRPLFLVCSPPHLGCVTGDCNGTTKWATYDEPLNVCWRDEINTNKNVALIHLACRASLLQTGATWRFIFSDQPNNGIETRLNLV